MESLAKLWCVYNGQKGTQKQIEKVIKQFEGREETLKTMLTSRGVI